jgi:hypothetical protein
LRVNQGASEDQDPLVSQAGINARPSKSGALNGIASDASKGPAKIRTRWFPRPG